MLNPGESTALDGAVSARGQAVGEKGAAERWPGQDADRESDGRDAGSQDGPQLHPCEALVEPRIRAKAVPLRRHGEMNQRRVARID